MKSSTKNAQLVNWEYTSGLHGQEVIFQLGKIANDTYALDFAFPLTIMNAFSIALACMDTKLCYTL